MTKWGSVLVLAAILAVPFELFPARVAHADAWRAQTLVDSIGVQLHTRFTGTSYGNLERVIGDLKYLGIMTVRDSPLDATSASQARYNLLASTDVRFVFTVRWDLPNTLARIENFERAHRGAVVAIEGPNEVDHWPITFNGLTGLAGAAAFQSALYDAVKSSHTLGSLPVYALDDFSADPDKIDFGNSHPYPQHGHQALGYLSAAKSREENFFPGKPVVFTEAGYFTLIGHKGWGGVDEETQAKLTVNLLLDAFAMGIKRVSLYELLDERPNSQDIQDHFGLFRWNHEPKPVAVALHNMTALLREDTPPGTPFALRPFVYTVDGLPPSARSMLIEKADGSVIVAIWNRPEIWDKNAEVPIPAPEVYVTLTLDVPALTAGIYDPLVGSNPIKTFAHVKSMNVPLSDHAVFVTIKPTQ